MVNPTNNPKILKKINYSKDDQLFCLSEKVHGANFTFMIHEKDSQLQFEMAKRTSKLSKDNDFFKHAVNHIKQKYEKKSFELFNHLKENLQEECTFYENIGIKKTHTLQSVYIYGELFGGYYPHEKVKNNGHTFSKIQDGVYYTNENDFYAFDLVLMLSNEKGKVDELWLCPQHMEKLFPMFGFDVYAKSIHIGSVSQMMKIDYHVNTTIPQTFYPHLPPLEKNTCEGMVMRPYNVSRLNKSPMIFKLKNPKFVEKTTTPKKKSSKTYDVSIDKYILDQVDCFINENRLSAAVSKIGKPDRTSNNYNKIKGMVIAEMCRDVLQSFEEENQETWKHIQEQKKEKLFRKYISYTCGDLVSDFSFD